MIDIGISKLLLISGIALVVIGPERLPKVARTLGALLGRAQRYVAEVKSEVSRSIELEELEKARRAFQDGARDMQSSIDQSLSELGQSAQDIQASLSLDADHSADPNGSFYSDGGPDAAPSYVRPNKRWRLKRGATPLWYRRTQGVRQHVQSGAARVQRHRPRKLT